MNKRKVDFILISGITGILCSFIVLLGVIFLSSVD